MEEVAHALLFFILVYAQIVAICIVSVVWVASISVREEKQTRRQECTCQRRRQSG